MAGFTDTIVLRGEECDYDPTTHLARIPCSNCGHLNEVEVEFENGQPQFPAFVCDNCGTYNTAEG